MKVGRIKGFDSHLNHLFKLQGCVSY